MEQRVAQPGDRICGSCGEANDPSRKFCRRCGAGLTEARIVAAARLPWYRRIFGGGEKKPKEYAAGERIDSMSKSAPKGGGGLGGIVKSIGLVRGLLGLVVMLGIFGYVGIPSVQSGINGLVDTVRTKGVGGIVDGITGIINPKLEAVRPIAFTANREIEGHPVGLLFDLRTNTDWQTADKAPTVKVTFKEPVELRSVIVRAGSLNTFVDLRRPSRIAIDFADGTTKEIDLGDVKDPQTFEISGPLADSVTIRILDTNGPEAAPIATSEIEFFAKSN
ncbi:MAG TPA: zinc ribbon domain-containing protein [Candidatus Nanopelagicales bacterium]|nr:zinc ribbon domain-containing protein [Candidatus Nanopelagicales bacterium]